LPTAPQSSRGVSYLERGYEDLVGKLRTLGADIAEVTAPDEPEAPEREAV
jgi:hypothetical protein